MKSHLILILLAAVTLISSCSTSTGPQVVESDTGRLYLASHLDGLRGMASGKRDAEAMRFANNIINKAGEQSTENGVYYNGEVKVIKWKYKGKEKYTAQRMADFGNGMIGWQGPTPASGFYSSNLSNSIIK